MLKTLEQVGCHAKLGSEHGAVEWQNKELVQVDAKGMTLGATEQRFSRLLAKKSGLPRSGQGGRARGDAAIQAESCALIGATYKDIREKH